MALTTQCQFPVENMTDCEDRIAATRMPHHSMFGHMHEYLTAIYASHNAKYTANKIFKNNINNYFIAHMQTKLC